MSKKFAKVRFLMNGEIFLSMERIQVLFFRAIARLCVRKAQIPERRKSLPIFTAFF